MKTNPRRIGDLHTLSVYKAIKSQIYNQNIDYFPETTIQTVNYLFNCYPNIKKVTSKFDVANSNNEKDLTLYLANGESIPVNLFLIKKAQSIQPKNPGAKSFFSKYFLSEKLQKSFNEEFEKDYLTYLQETISQKIESHYITDKTELKMLISNSYPKFTDEILAVKNNFLYSLREKCFSLLKDSYNSKDEGFIHAYNSIFMTEDLNLITRYGKSNEDIRVEEFNPGAPNFSDIQIFKVGKYTVGIQYGEVALTLRFKFESNPTSSIKLAASYKSRKQINDAISENSKTIQLIDQIINETVTCNKDSSNAIGKCHEVLTYYYFLKDQPNINQVDKQDCVDQLNKYYMNVTPETLKQLFKATSTIIPVIKEKLTEKYVEFKIDSIELVPESYVRDKLDNTDLQLILKVKGDYVVENISLKAIARKNSKITTKNPGIGTILGPSYFNIGSMDSIVNEVKAQYENGELNHRDCLEIIAENLGSQLEQANQDQLKQGIENLLGNILTGITIYNETRSYCKEHSAIQGVINIFSLSPTAIQNTLSWNNDTEALSMRVKFSRGQSHGWSSIKITSEYQFE